MKKRHYTIVIVGNGAEILRRFRVTHRTLVGAIAGTLSLGTVGMICGLVVPPLALTWRALQRKVDHLEIRNRALEEEHQRVQDRVVEVGDRLQQFEADTLRLSALAELSGTKPRSSKPSGGPSPAPADAAGGSVLPGLDNLLGRSEQLSQRLEDLESRLLQKVESSAGSPIFAPLDGPVGDGFGMRIDPFTGVEDFHEGVDILAPWGTPVKAPASGVVSHCGYATGYGLCLFIDHPSGVQTRLAHLSRTSVRLGDRVTAGQMVGLVGSTGRSVGPHLHYEVLIGDRKVNPMRFLRPIRGPSPRSPTQS